ncbi:type VI secretion system tip protein VgrG [Pseudomonas sp. HMWF021]|uniref:type VI secretion system Vgr family protein n=1 Tax=Pseudomonas sp. HMWF021 TaxID=2056857 RepID=UPI000D340D72|nr:type VI secretion system tip protein VgrG [Pseudomonas sp. HMWF021]PTT26664.1 type VI secretion system tip protein VgrG [Pseudomonas sp. HMWF021]
MPTAHACFSLSLNDFKHDLQVLSFTGHESISQPYAFDVELVSQRADLSLEGLMHQQAFLAFDLEGHGIHGVVNRIARGDRGKRLTRYNLTLVPRLAYLQHRCNQRIFQQMSVPQIITRILADNGIHRDLHRFHLGADYPPREYCVQAESDLHFIQRLCQEEGIHYHFQHSRENHLLVLGDDQTVFPRLDRPTPYRQDNGMVAQTPAIRAFEVRMETRPTASVRRDHDFRKARFALEATHRPDSDADRPALEDYRYPGHFTDGARGKQLTRRALESHRADHLQACGDSDQPSLVSGHFLPITEHFCKETNDLWLLTEVNHRGKQPAVLQETLSGDPGAAADGFVEGYRNDFVATPWDVIYRPPQRWQKPRIVGSQTAVVTGPVDEEIHCDAFGRIKVQFYWDREGQHDDHSSCWLRLASNWAGSAHGSVTLPRVGMEVLVSFLEGDPDHPVVSGCLINSANPAPYALPEHKTRSVFRSRSSPDNGGFNELHVEDRAGRELIYLRAQRDLEHKVEHDSRLDVGNERHETIKGHSISVLQAEDQRTVHGDRKTRLHASDHLHVSADSHSRVDQLQVIEAGRQIHLNAGDHLVLNAGKSISITVGGEHLVIGHGGIFSSSAIQVGGSPMAVSSARVSMPDGVDNLTAPPPLPAVLAPTQLALLAASNAMGTTFCPLCEACRDGVCLPRENAA